MVVRLPVWARETHVLENVQFNTRSHPASSSGGTNGSSPKVIQRGMMIKHSPLWRPKFKSEYSYTRAFTPTTCLRGEHTDNVIKEHVPLLSRNCKTNTYFALTLSPNLEHVGRKLLESVDTYPPDNKTITPIPSRKCQIYQKTIPIRFRSNMIIIRPYLYKDESSTWTKMQVQQLITHES